MKSTAIRNVRIVNEGSIIEGDLFIKNDRIEKIGGVAPKADTEIRGDGKLLIPGLIDDQVHFREPGLTQKANILTESRAAAAGGITSYMEMPNTNPTTTTLEALEEKHRIAAKNSLVNYSFYFGITNSNVETALSIDPKRVCGLKAFLGSSTGDMLVDSDEALRKLFSETSMIVACHSEDEETIKANLKSAKERYGDEIPFPEHPNIRSREACYASTLKITSLAKEYGTKLHVLHISTKEELSLFEAGEADKLITAEACIHHLWFSDVDYNDKGAFIKWNPAIKSLEDREALRAAVRDGTIDILATDHAPHTLEEKENNYMNCPSGGPLVQHALIALLQLAKERVLSLETIVNRACHAPARRFQVRDRGYLREGYFADLVLVDLDAKTAVSREGLLYKCGWSPFEGQIFDSKVVTTWVNGTIVYDSCEIKENKCSMPLEFRS